MDHSVGMWELDRLEDCWKNKKKAGEIQCTECQFRLIKLYLSYVLCTRLAHGKKIHYGQKSEIYENQQQEKKEN